MTTKPPLQKDSSRNSIHTSWKPTKPWHDRQYQITGEEKTRNQRLIKIHQHTIKPPNNKNN
jgi:hypothetical protein